MASHKPPAHQRSWHRCWARNADGSACGKELGSWAAREEHIPYCERHLRLGDEAFRIRAHPNPALGKVLCARTRLPAGYRLIYWGRQCMDQKKFAEDWMRHLRGESCEGRGFFPKAQPMAEKDANDSDYILDTGLGVAVNPRASRAMCRGSVAQYASMPGPGEEANLASLKGGAFPRERICGQCLAGVCLVTLEPVDAGAQVAWFYVAGDRRRSNQWLRQKMGVKPVDMGWPGAPLPPCKKRAKSARAKKTKKAQTGSTTKAKVLRKPAAQARRKS